MNTKYVGCFENREKRKYSEKNVFFFFNQIINGSYN